MPVLHLQDAVLEHAAWWTAFEALLRSEGNAVAAPSKRSLEHPAVARDDQCAIGRWLYGDGAQFSDLAAFQMVKNLHKELHDLSGMALLAKSEGSLELVVALIGDIHKIRHDLFMAWDALNDIIGGYD